MKQDIRPFIDVANAIQALIEAVQPLEQNSPEVATALPRARRPRVELMDWVDEQR